MELIETIEYRGYKIEVTADYDAENPLSDDEFAPLVVLHEGAQRHYGWTTDKNWAERLDQAFEKIAGHGVTKTMYGPRGALAIVNRWLKVAHGMRVVWPIGALDHSGVMVYLGNTGHWSDPGSWDSGWVGWWLVTPELVTAWGATEQVKIEESAKASFDDFAAWVSGDVVRYSIVSPEGDIIEDSPSIYGGDAISRADGWALEECHGIIDAHIEEVALPGVEVGSR